MDITTAVVSVLIAAIFASVILYAIHRKRRIRAGGAIASSSFFFEAGD